MYNFLLTTLLSCIAAGIILAENINSQPTNKSEEHSIITSGDKSYERVKILRTEPDGVVIMHSRGVTKIPFSELPEDLRKEHEVILPWFIKPRDAAQYWPNTIQDVINLLAPEIASAKFEHEKAKQKLINSAQAMTNSIEVLSTFLKNLPALPKHDMAYWYTKLGHTYAYTDGILLSPKNGLAILSGRVLSICDDSVILIITSNNYIKTVVACFVDETENLFDDQPFYCLGVNIGSYRYVSASGAVKKVQYYKKVLPISKEVFIKLGENAFPEIEEAKCFENEQSKKRNEQSKKRLEEDCQRLEKEYQQCLEDEHAACQGLHNAGRQTYESLLAQKISEKSQQALANAQAESMAAAREAQYRKQQEQQERERRQLREEQAREKASAKAEYYRLKGPVPVRGGW